MEFTSDSHRTHIGFTWNSHRTHIELTSDSLPREFGAIFSERISGLPSASHRSAQILRTSPKLDRCAGSGPTLDRCAGSERLSLYNYEGGGRAQGEAGAEKE